jgi:hypothetical protein
MISRLSLFQDLFFLFYLFYVRKLYFEIVISHYFFFNIGRAILNMIVDARPVDVLVVYLSGHGGLCWPSRNNQYANGYFVTRTGRVSCIF